jgi:N-terminal domain of anti-restriction factor ArdC
MNTTHKLALWRGSQQTAEHVREEIARRYGEAEAKEYDPQINCFTLPTWNKLGYRVRKGEKAIRSMTLIEEKDPNAKVASDATKEGEEAEVIKYPKTVYLFYIKQVEKR